MLFAHVWSIERPCWRVSRESQVSWCHLRVMCSLAIDQHVSFNVAGLCVGVCECPRVCLSCRSSLTISSSQSSIVNCCTVPHENIERGRQREGKNNDQRYINSLSRLVSVNPFTGATQVFLYLLVPMAIALCTLASLSLSFSHYLYNTVSHHQSHSWSLGSTVNIGYTYSHTGNCNDYCRRSVLFSWWSSMKVLSSLLLQETQQT